LRASGTCDADAGQTIRLGTTTFGAYLSTDLEPVRAVAWYF
jgi:hypothetical protein